MFSAQYVLDLRIAEFNLDGLTSLSADELCGNIVIQLGTSQPVSYTFRSLPLPSESSGILSILKSYDSNKSISSPCSVTVLSPIKLQGYRCIAQGMQRTHIPIGNSHFLHALRSRPSRSVQSARVVEQFISKIDLQHGQGCSTKAGYIEVVVRVIQLQEANPLLDPENAAAVIHDLPVLSRPIAAPNMPFCSSVEFVRNSAGALKHHHTIRSSKSFPSNVRESTRSSVSVQLQRIRERWRNPDDINFKEENHRPTASVSISLSASQLRPSSAPVMPGPGRYVAQTGSRGAEPANIKTKVNRGVSSIIKSGKSKGLSEIKRVGPKKNSVKGKVEIVPIKNKTDRAFKEAIEKLHRALAPTVAVLLKQSEAVEMGLNFIPVNIGQVRSSKSIPPSGLSVRERRYYSDLERQHTEQASAGKSTLEVENCNNSYPPMLIYSKM